MAMATSTEEIPRESWRQYFDEFSRDMPALETSIEIEGRDIGDQFEAEHVILTGITYDHKDDVLVVGVDSPAQPSPEELQHLIYSPQKIFVATTGDGQTVFDVQDAENQTLITLRPVPELPLDE
jgi:hypothetical protein